MVYDPLATINPEDFFEDNNFGRGRKKKTRKSRLTHSTRSPIVQNNLELKSIFPKSENQKTAFEDYEDGKNLLLHGIAGTGKTFIGVYLAMRDLKDKVDGVKKVVIVRSAVASRDQGFLPGGIAEKSAVYEAPYKSIFSELFGRDDSYELLKKRREVEFITTSFIRGITINNAVVIVDEVQNMSAQELHTIITRLGKNTKLILCGDHRQDDLTGKKGEVSGLKDIIRVLVSMGTMTKIEFEMGDIQRSPFVKEYLIQRLKLGLDKPLDI